MMTTAQQNRPMPDAFRVGPCFSKCQQAYINPMVSQFAISDAMKKCVMSMCAIYAIWQRM